MYICIYIHIYIYIWVCAYVAPKLSRCHYTVIILFLRPLPSPKSREQMKNSQLNHPLYRLGPVPVETAADVGTAADTA